MIDIFTIEGEDYNGLEYSFDHRASLEETIKYCQELLETLDGGHFKIFNSINELVAEVEW